MYVHDVHDVHNIPDVSDVQRFTASPRGLNRRQYRNSMVNDFLLSSEKQQTIKDGWSAKDRILGSE
jgi:hypothetical protein